MKEGIRTIKSSNELKIKKMPKKTKQQNYK